MVLEEENFNSIRGILTLTDWDWGGARDCTIPDSLNISYFLQATFLVDLKFSILILMANTKFKCFPTTNFFIILFCSFVKRFMSMLFKACFHQINKEKYNMNFALFFLFPFFLFFLYWYIWQVHIFPALMHLSSGCPSFAGSIIRMAIWVDKFPEEGYKIR